MKICLGRPRSHLLILDTPPPLLASNSHPGVPHTPRSMASSTVARRPVIGQRVVDVFELCKRVHDEAVEFQKPTEHWMEDAEFYKAELERLEPTLDSTPEVSCHRPR